MSGETGSLVIEKATRNAKSVQININAVKTSFPVIETDVIANNLNLIALAQEAGKKNLPSSNQASRYGTDEEKIDVAIDDIAKKYHQTACSLIEELDKQFNSDESDTRRVIDETRVFPSKFESQVDQYRVSSESKYQLAEERYLNKRRTYQEFKNRHHIERDAKQIKSSEVFYSIMILAIGVILEGGINSEFFAINNENGLLGGILSAAIASFINVVPTATLGYYGIRFVNRKDITFLWGCTATLLSVVTTLSVAWFVGHWREGAEMTEWAFLFNSVESYVLFLITVFIGVFSMQKGYAMGDPCPGYTEKENEYRNAFHNWSEIRNDYRKNLAGIERDISNQISDNIGVCRNGLQSMYSSILMKQNILVAYDNALRSLEKNYHALISRYRTENEKSRTDVPPVYFQREVPFDLSRLPSIQTDSGEFDKHRLSVLEGEVENLCRESKDIQEQIHKTFNSFEDQLKIKKDTMQ